jgi:hypothetical protein
MATAMVSLSFWAVVNMVFRFIEAVSIFAFLAV